MADIDIKVDGLKQFQKNLKAIDAELPKDLRKLLNVVATDVVDRARPLIPRRSGRAAASLKVASTQKSARIKGGSARVPYYPWLEFGGKVGRNDSVVRPHKAGGRYMFPALAKERPTLGKKLDALLIALAEKVTHGG